MILHSDEKLSHKPPSYKQMDEFREVLEQCSLTDLGFLATLSHGITNALDMPTQKSALIEPLLLWIGEQSFQGAR